ncbi:MAG: hypothetical protein U1A77_16130 [Pirellulales bacterium]
MKRHLLVGIFGTNILVCALAVSTLFAGVGTQNRQYQHQGEPTQTQCGVQFDQTPPRAVRGVQIQQQSCPVPGQQQASPAKPRPRQSQATQQGGGYRQQWIYGTQR